MFAGLRSLILALAVAMAGCAASVTRPTNDVKPLLNTATPTSVALHITGSPTIQASADWQTFRAEWRAAFASAAAKAGLQFTYLEADSGDQPAGTVLARVVVNDYRYLTPGGRFGFGIMTGNAFIDANAEFFEFPGKRSIGMRKYSTSSTAWQGVFSAMTDKQVLAISDEMIHEVIRK